MASPPTVTASDSDQFNASVTGTIAGKVLTVTAVSSGVLVPGQTITGTGIATGTIIESICGKTVLYLGTYWKLLFF